MAPFNLCDHQELSHSRHGRWFFDVGDCVSIIDAEGIIHVQDTFPNLAIVNTNKLHRPDTTYWPKCDGVLREEFTYFARTALSGGKVTIGTPEDATGALEATLAEESASAGKLVRIGA